MIQRVSFDRVQLPTRRMKKDDFLKLLVAQLKNQSPLSPIEDREFLVQMTQITMLEQMVNVATSLSSLKEMVQRTNTLSLLGKEVNAVSAEGERFEGVVNALYFRDGEAILSIGGRQLSLSQLSYISLLA
jgi:flagellar basal-body rod modification protein FlgD